MVASVTEDANTAHERDVQNNLIQVSWDVVLHGFGVDFSCFTSKMSRFSDNDSAKSNQMKSIWIDFSDPAFHVESPIPDGISRLNRVSGVLLGTYGYPGGETVLIR